MLLTCESLRPSHPALQQPSVGEAVLEDIAKKCKKNFFKVCINNSVFFFYPCS